MASVKSYEVGSERHTEEGIWFTNNREHRKKGRMFHMEQQNMEKEEESSTWNNQKARKNHLGGGGFGVMNYNNGRFRKIHMVELTC